MYEDTWVSHIAARHPELAPYLDEVEKTCQSPTLICESGTELDGWLFVNEAVTIKNRPLRVVVKPVGADGEVRTAVFSSTVVQGTVIWRP